MAFITNKEVSAKRASLKKAFPSKSGWKLSITGGNSSTLRVDIMEYPIGFEFPEHGDINPYHLQTSMDKLELNQPAKDAAILMYKIMKEGHWDRSDIMTDYFNCAYYYYLAIGKWNKPAVPTNKLM